MDVKLVEVSCPHCNEPLVIPESEVNCGVFRHGPVEPHASLQVCEAAKQSATTISGCFKPFRLTREPTNPTKWKAEACDYI